MHASRRLTANTEREALLLHWGYERGSQYVWYTKYTSTRYQVCMFSFSRRKCTTTVYQYIQRIYSRIQSHVLDFQKAQHTSTSKGSRHSSTSSYHIPVPGTRSSFTYLPHLELPTRVSSAVRFAAGLLSHNELLLYE